MGDFTLRWWVAWLYGIAGAILTFLLSRLWRKYHKMLNRQNAIELGVQALLRSQIILIYNTYIEKNCFPIYERDNITHLFKQYKRLGGNSNIEDLIEKLYILPTKESNDCESGD